MGVDCTLLIRKLDKTSAICDVEDFRTGKKKSPLHIHAFPKRVKSDFPLSQTSVCVKSRVVTHTDEAC